MKKIFALIVVFFFLSVHQVGAHAEGLIPFFKINGSYPDIHPIKKETVVPPAISIPEDLAKEKYIVNEELTFSIETTVLSKVYPEDVLSKLSYEIHFGDGTIAEGTKAVHAYTKPGTKVLTVYAKINDPEQSVPPQAIETAQIDILPYKGYTLPQPQISVNNQTLTPSEEVNMRSPIIFEAGIKNKPSAEIVSYVWDFGEGGSGDGKKLAHTYTTDPAVATPVLKVTDKNGLVVYTFGVLTSGKNTQGYTFAANTVGAIILGVQAVVVIIAVIWFAIAVRSKKHTKRS